MGYLQNNLNTQLTGVAVPDLGNVSTNLLRINDVDPNFELLNDGTSMLYRLLSMLGADTPANQPQYQFFNDDQYQVTTHANGAIDAVTTALVVDDAIGIVNAVLENPATGELMLITAVNDTTWTIVRGYQGTTAGLIADGADLALIGATLPDNGDPNGGIVQLPNLVDNYCSFISQTVNSSDLQEVTNMLNGTAQLGGEFSKITLSVMRQMDRALRVSKGYLDINFNGTGKAAYFTKGLNEYITENATLPNVGLDWWTFNDQFNDAFFPTSSSMRKTMLVSQTLFDRITAVAWERWTANPDFEEAIGATTKTINLTSGNTIDIVLDKHGFSGTGVQGYLLDMPYVKLKEMQGFGLQWREVPKGTNHGSSHEVFGSYSVKLQLPELHRTITLGA